MFLPIFYQLITVNTYFSWQQEMISLDSLESSASEKKSKNNTNWPLKLDVLFFQWWSQGNLPFGIYLFIIFIFIIFWWDKIWKKQFAGILSNAQQKNIHTKEVYLTLNNDCIFPNELSEVIWLRDNFIV